MDTHFGLFRNLRLNGTAQQFEIPLRSVVSPTQCRKYCVEGFVITQIPFLPDPTCRSVKGTNPFHLWSTQTRLQRLGNDRQQDLNRVSHLRDQPVTQAVAAVSEYCFKAPLRKIIDAHFRFKKLLGIEYGLRLVDKTQATT